MKEQNARLNLIVFLQLIVIGSIGTGVTEMFKAESSTAYATLSIILGGFAFVSYGWLYYKILKQSKKRKE